MGRRGFSATKAVLGLICVMYVITYVDRVNVSKASSVFQRELHFTSVQVGLVFSAFVYPYLPATELQQA
jgi:sugar phosphate permease